jgi:hypothetical protein
MRMYSTATSVTSSCSDGPECIVGLYYTRNCSMSRGKTQGEGGRGGGREGAEIQLDTVVGGRWVCSSVVGGGRQRYARLRMHKTRHEVMSGFPRAKLQSLQVPKSRPIHERIGVMVHYIYIYIHNIYICVPQIEALRATRYGDRSLSDACCQRP